MNGESQLERPSVANRWHPAYFRFLSELRQFIAIIETLQRPWADDSPILMFENARVLVSSKLKAPGDLFLSLKNV